MARFTAGQIRHETTFDDAKEFEEFERYSGWTNRETWSLNLYLTNDQGLYEMTRRHVAGALRGLDTDEMDPDNRQTYLTNKAGEAVKDLLEQDLLDVETWGAAAVLALVDEVGSYWRVDWYEIGQSWLEDVGDQLDEIAGDDDEDEGV